MLYGSIVLHACMHASSVERSSIKIRSAYASICGQLHSWVIQMAKHIYRPRLTETEVAIIAKALKALEALSRKKQQQTENRKDRIRTLRRQMRHQNPYTCLQELKKERALLKQDLQHNYLAWALACMHLAKRFQMLAEGGGLHSAKHTSRLETEPKPVEKA